MITTLCTNNNSNNDNNNNSNKIINNNNKEVNPIMYVTWSGPKSKTDEQNDSRKTWSHVEFGFLTPLHT